MEQSREGKSIAVYLTYAEIDHLLNLFEAFPKHYVLANIVRKLTVIQYTEKHHE